MFDHKKLILYKRSSFSSRDQAGLICSPNYYFSVKIKKQLQNIAEENLPLYHGVIDQEAF